MKILLAAASVLLLSTSAFAADLNAELTTAATHAGLAAKATDIMGVHMHMHHAINCLEGAKGADYDATNANPCAKSGNGAIPDASGAQKAKLQMALTSANAGLASTDLAAAQKDAADAGAAIDGAK